MKPRNTDRTDTSDRFSCSSLARTQVANKQGDVSDVSANAVTTSRALCRHCGSTPARPALLPVLHHRRPRRTTNREEPPMMERDVFGARRALGADAGTHAISASDASDRAAQVKASDEARDVLPGRFFRPGPPKETPALKRGDRR